MEGVEIKWYGSFSWKMIFAAKFSPPAKGISWSLGEKNLQRDLAILKGKMLSLTLVYFFPGSARLTISWEGGSDRPLLATPKHQGSKGQRRN